MFIANMKFENFELFTEIFKNWLLENFSLYLDKTFLYI